MKPWIFGILMLAGRTLMSQGADSTALWDKYREDQFYLGLNYNLLLDLPDGVSQEGLSYGLMGGFIRDIPLNPACTFALGIGLGYGFSSYYTNLRAIREGDNIRYEILAGNADYKRNKLEMHLIEVPLEFRWRNSTRTEYKFWRIYGGLKLGYVAGSRSKFVTNSFKEAFKNPDTENFRYGLMLNVGYNTFNLHVYYGLNSLFEDGIVIPEEQSLQMMPVHIGLIFYIL